MNKRTFLRNSILATVTLALPSCLKRQETGKPPGVDYYTCTMHPSVHSQVPGKCPICGMDLVPVMLGGSAGSKEEAQSREFEVPVEREQQIGVTYAVVERKALRRTLRAAGIVRQDASRSWRFVARADGYIGKLAVTSPGEVVEKGTPLMSIYSPDLLTGERELLQLIRARDARDGGAAALVQAAEDRLRQWNLTDGQIAALEKSQTPPGSLDLLSPFRGVVQSLAAQQGASVKQGDTLAEVVDYSVVWVWADFYENEFPVLKKGREVSVTCKAWPGEEFKGVIAQIAPALDETTRTVKVRTDIQNPDFKLIPGMFAAVELVADGGEVLAVPIGAVMPTGTRNVAFVDKGEGKLEPRFVQTGREFDDDYEVLSGLAQGERVVASAVFLIDAESKVQGALKDFDPSAAAKREGAQ